MSTVLLNSSNDKKSDLTIVSNMKKLAIICVIFFFLCGFSQVSKNNIPKDLKEYIDNAEDCQHLAGE
ncbi:hypothetical protein [Xenorhabdus littoralis]|uniref:hypothetical protein n=1 Tax=Xenorhabdus littoralis TaxID=2582835 RepID=UPI0029E80F39|nr:hypothetical protein [Xenorhabdus sp. psl]MDX7991309.1 hypothetical protein [Xenorhabdus sp. psl]